MRGDRERTHFGDDPVSAFKDRELAQQVQRQHYGNPLRLDVEAYREFVKPAEENSKKEFVPRAAFSYESEYFLNPKQFLTYMQEEESNYGMKA